MDFTSSLGAEDKSESSSQKLSPNNRGNVSDVPGSSLGKTMEKEFLRYQDKAHLACADVENLVDSYVDEDLPDALKAKLQAHVLKCSECRELVDDVVTIVEVARTLSSQAMPSEVRERLREHLKREVGYEEPRPKLFLVK